MLVWIAECLKTGETWERSFCEALCSSSVFIPIISRETFRDAVEISEDSPCDNVILECDLALSLVLALYSFSRLQMVDEVCLTLHAVTFITTCTHSSDFLVVFDL